MNTPIISASISSHNHAHGLNNERVTINRFTTHRSGSLTPSSKVTKRKSSLAALSSCQQGILVRVAVSDVCS